MALRKMNFCKLNKRHFIYIVTIRIDTLRAREIINLQ
jgi:hypothetical protein